MEPLPALDKKELLDKRDRHPDKKKDNRNLYLVKEGGLELLIFFLIHVIKDFNELFYL